MVTVNPYEPGDLVLWPGLRTNVCRSQDIDPEDMSQGRAVVGYLDPGQAFLVLSSEFETRQDLWWKVNVLIVAGETIGWLMFRGSDHDDEVPRPVQRRR